jgi:predicted Zn-dependent protease
LIDLLTGNMAGGDVIAGAGKMLIGASYSRGAEAEADATAVEILTRAGISTAGLEAFFQQLATQEESSGPKGRLGEMLQVISSHPRSAARASAVAGAQGIATKPALSKRDWQALQAICGSD